MPLERAPQGICSKPVVCDEACKNEQLGFIRGECIVRAKVTFCNCYTMKKRMGDPCQRYIPPTKD